MPGSTLIATWSGGKDSSLACYKTLLKGHKVGYLVNTISKEHRRVRFHGTEDGLIQAQAGAIGIPLCQIETRGNSYERDFKEGLKSLISSTNVDGIVFGDIHLEHCREWAERVCGELGTSAIEPLWNRRPEEIILDFIDSGFEAWVISCQADLLDETFVGRRIDKRYLEDVTHKGIDVCGEHGEYHTLVTDGPIFKRRMVLQESQRVLRDGYWFLDIRKYALAEK